MVPENILSHVCVLLKYIAFNQTVKSLRVSAGISWNVIRYSLVNLIALLVIFNRVSSRSCIDSIGTNNLISN